MAGNAIRIVEARWPVDRAAVEALFREYIESLAVDVSFQNVDTELASLPGKYARPAGVVLMALAGDVVAGGGGYRMLEPGVCEMKRLYVRPAFRGQGIARELAEDLIADARANGYRAMVLDTLESMNAPALCAAWIFFHPGLLRQSAPGGDLPGTRIVIAAAQN